MLTPTALRAIIASDTAEYRQAIEGDYTDDRPWWLRRRELPDGRVLHLEKMPHFFRLSVGPREWPVFDSVYDFEADETAWRAILEWDGTGDPEGWFRHPHSGRYRPGGSRSQEYVAPQSPAR